MPASPTRYRSVPEPVDGQGSMVPVLFFYICALSPYRKRSILFLEVRYT